MSLSSVVVFRNSFKTNEWHLSYKSSPKSIFSYLWNQIIWSTSRSLSHGISLKCAAIPFSPETSTESRISRPYQWSESGGPKSANTTQVKEYFLQITLHFLCLDVAQHKPTISNQRTSFSLKYAVSSTLQTTQRQSRSQPMAPLPNMLTAPSSLSRSKGIKNFYLTWGWSTTHISRKGSSVSIIFSFIHFRERKAFYVPEHTPVCRYEGGRISILIVHKVKYDRSDIENDLQM